MMPAVREQLWEMRARGEVEILQGGQVLAAEGLALEDVRGPIRARWRVGEGDREGGGGGAQPGGAGNSK